LTNQKPLVTNNLLTFPLISDSKSEKINLPKNRTCMQSTILLFKLDMISHKRTMIMTMGISLLQNFTYLLIYWREVA